MLDTKIIEDNKRFLSPGLSIFISVINGLFLFMNFLLGIHLAASLADNTLQTNINKKLYYRIYIITSVIIGIFIISSMAFFLVSNKKNPTNEVKMENYLYEGFMITNIVIFNLAFLIVSLIGLNINFNK